MISKLLLDILMFVPNLILESLPEFSISLPNGVFSGLKTLCAFISWFPISELMPIVITSVSLQAFRNVWALLIRVKSFIPTMGA